MVKVTEKIANITTKGKTDGLKWRVWETSFSPDGSGDNGPNWYKNQIYFGYRALPYILYAYKYIQCL